MDLLYAAGLRRSRVLVVDDNPSNLRLLEVVMTKEGYEVITATDGEPALALVEQDSPDLILLDMNMPGLDGLETCRRLKNNPKTRLIPIIIVTAANTEEAKLKSIEAGADDFLTKPISMTELRARTRALTQLKQFTDELEHADAVMTGLAQAIEARDPYTEGHCFRLVSYTRVLGERVNLSPEDLRALEKGALLHDLGKIAVPDSALLKPGRLTPDEFAVIKEHPLVGERLCRPMHSLQPVWPVIRHHHERWDGSGYPDGLSGDNIPLTARILAVADVFDALTTQRPYRMALPREEAFAILQEEANRGFWDAKLVNEFITMLPLSEISQTVRLKA